MSRQDSIESTDYTFAAGGQRMAELVNAFKRWWAFIEMQGTMLNRLEDTLIANIPSKV